MPVLRNVVLTILAPILAPLLAQHTTAALAQEKTAEDKNVADMRQKCAELKDKYPVLQRLRIDGYSVANKTVNVTGVFLRGGLDLDNEKEDEELNKAVTNVVVSMPVFGEGYLADTRKPDRVEPTDLPHVKLQALANANRRDGILLEPVTFDKDGIAVLTAKVSSPEDKKWLEDEWLIESGKPLRANAEKKLTRSRSDIDRWTIGKAALQAKLAASKGNRIRIDRVWFEWEVTDNKLSRKLVMDGISLDPLPSEATLNNLATQLWPELPWETVPKLLPDPRATKVDRSVSEKLLVKQLQAGIAERQALDGVRIDPGMGFDGDGRLVLAGITPKLDSRFATELADAVKEIAKSPSKAGGPTFLQIAAEGASAANMTVIPTNTLLTKLREWAAENLDDVLLNRLYFSSEPDTEPSFVGRLMVAASGKPRLTLAGRFAELKDVEEIRNRYLSIAPEYFRNQYEPARWGLRRDLKPFSAGLTAHLKTLVESDQNKWAGVLVERGYFTYPTTGGAQYHIRGLVNHKKQITEMERVVTDARADQRWTGYFESMPGPVEFVDMPLAPMLSRLQRVTPGYEEFDHLELTEVKQQQDALVLLADSYHQTNNDSAERKAAVLLKSHPQWQRRAKPGVKIQVTSRASRSDESRWLRPYLGAEALANERLPRTMLERLSAIRHIPDSSATWYLSALYHSYVGDQELVLRDLHRVIKLEKELIPTGGGFQDDMRDARYALVEKIGPSCERAAVEALEIWLRREIRDGRVQIQLERKPDVVLPK